jgi:5-(aminomethyl)-3-furanmethanol phosphate kinase
MRPADGPTVVKIGGSCASSLDLRRWTASVAQCGGRAVVVPGGGPFADAVRAAQPRMGFDDAAAHHMAMLGMEQFGRALASFDGRLAVADSMAAVRRSLAAGKVAVWLPARMAMQAADIPASWQVTSDSLAAWLAGKLHASRLLLLKQVELSRQPVAVTELAEQGIVDPAFPKFLKASGVAAFVLGPADHMAVPAALCHDPPGTPIVAPAHVSAKWTPVRR